MPSEEHVASDAAVDASVTADVSVVLCAYTEERWEELVAAIESVRAQSMAAKEIIVVIDNNPSLLARLKESVSDITAVENTLTRGAGEARNLGVDLAKGEIIALLDDDAAAERSWIAYAAAAFSDPAVLGVGGTITPDWEGSRPRWMAEEFYWTVGCTYPGLPETPAPTRNLIAANMFVRRDIFIELGGFRSGWGKTGARSGTEETDLCIRGGQRYPEGIWLYDPAVAVRHRVPKARAQWRYFVSRCYDEGVAKASIVNFVGKDDGLASERAYTARTLPRGVLRGLRSTLRGDVAGLSRSASILVGLTATVLGYLKGRVSLRPAPAAAQYEFNSAGTAAETAATEDGGKLGLPGLGLPGSDRPGPRRRQRATLNSLLLLLAAATFLVCIADVNSAVRPLLVLVAACLVPGGALLTRLPTDDGLEALGLAIGLSLGIETAGAIVMAWTGWWHPFAWALLLGLLASGVLLVDLCRVLLMSRRSARA
jgi:glycosyltransferase involved in cell wall biosynthesis